MYLMSRVHTPTTLLHMLTWGMIVLGLSASAARATPLENPRSGGLFVGSPVDPHPANIMRNPAAIGPLGSLHLYLDGGLRLEHGRVHRSDIRSDTGNPGPGADLSFGSEPFLHLTPDGYFGITWDLGSELVVVGVALHTPFSEWQRFGVSTPDPTPDQESSLRYHRIESRWFHLFLTGAVAVRVHKRFFVGLGISYVRSMLDMVFARDRRLRDASVPPYEDPLSTGRLHIQGAEDSFCFNVGLLIRLPRDVDVGISYRSKVVGVNQSDIRAEGSVRLTRFEADTGAWRTYSGRAVTAYELPDALTLGARWTLKSWDLGFGFEWSRWSEHKDIRFTLTGNQLRGEAGLANWDVNFKQYRGFQDVFRVSVSGAKRLGAKLRLTVGAMYESNAVPRQWVNASAMDSHKLDLAFGLVWRPHRRVGLYVGYGIILAPDVRVEQSGYDPGHVVRCVEDHVDILWSESCQRTIEGKGRPTAAGRYFLMTHRFGLGISYDH